jgi:hypothetical protein
MTQPPIFSSAQMAMLAEVLGTLSKRLSDGFDLKLADAKTDMHLQIEERLGAIARIGGKRDAA